MKTKNSYRNIAIGADAIEVLKGMERKDEYVFPSPFGGPMSPDSVLHMLQRVLKRAGLERIRFHDLRHPNVKPKTKTFSSFLEIFAAVSYAHTPMQKSFIFQTIST